MAGVDSELLLDPAVQRNPFSYYQRLREHEPVFRMPETGFYVLTRYEDPRAVLRDTEMVSGVERICDQLIDAFIDRGRCEFVSEFAFPLPGIVISEQLGLAPDQIGTFRRWADAMLAPAQGLLADEDATITYADIEAEAQHYLADVFGARRARPTKDLISALVSASDEEERPLSMHELQNLLQQLITGGYITTADAITSAMWLLIENPEQMRRRRGQRDPVQTLSAEETRR